MRPWVVAVRAALPSPRPQGWQASQMAAGLARTGRPTTLLGDAGRPEGTPDTVDAWLGGAPAGLAQAIPATPSRPPLAGLRFRRSLARLRSRDAVLLCRDPRVAAAQPRGWAAVVMEWHVRPEPEALQRPDLHVTVAPGLADDLRAAGVPEDRLLLLPNACGLDPGRAAARRPRPGGPVLALGLHRRGGLDLALQAWASDRSLPPLLLGGVDQGGARVRAWARRVDEDPALRGRVRFIGGAWAGAREDLLDTVAAWLAVYPDDADTRTRLCPLQVVDALGSGLPLVAPDLPSVRALGGAVHAFAPGDPGALVNAVHDALRAPIPAAPRPSWTDRARTLAEVVERRLEVA